ncbi:GmrSD restriction endonuclease domain-containing protein [Lachnoclostridium phytofermentans]|uniref:GmrSD restriction endonuclease domain-containing protein n=1 Tax=Lachnoclostridium phytofermentans TaxID=66219 RepID=UPI000496C3A1|nr:DUF262 domain-containing protein [Lachnoclostridium phytofermentans]
MINDKCEEKIISFIDLLRDHKIEIPIIQRDYAQGREESIKILEHFLEALYYSIKKRKNIRLDFIYGNIVNGYFQPLDGQQRLTTLFLLHWYAYMRDINEIKNNDKEILLNFTYETRISSREFCNALVSNTINILYTDKCISDKIIDSNWFFLSWQNDPTIKSMLNSIDKIHQYFSEIDDLWENLVNGKYITFYYVELENIGLTDDLYIKMNARGKLLTAFENFKAELQKKCSEENWEDGKRPDEKFSFKIDTDWTDYFWEGGYRRDYTVDSAHMRFMTAIIMIRIAIEKREDRVQLIQKLNDNTEFINSTLISQDTFSYLKRCYELYCEKTVMHETLTLPFPLWRHSTKSSFLSAIVYDEGQYSQTQSDSSYTTKVLFYAQTEYLLKNETFNQDKYYDWMRVVRNIVSRGDVDKDGKRPDIIRSPQTFLGVINLINELVAGCSDIYDYLYNNTIKSTFAKEQVEEERTKAKLINENPNIKLLIFKAEDNELLRGSIRFMLYCIDYDKDSLLINTFNEALFSDAQEVFERYFNKESEISPDLRRAFLCVKANGKYEFYNYWWSRWTVNDATKRKVLDNYRELEYLIYSDEKEYFKNLILALVQSDLKSFVTTFNPPEDMPNWKKRLIKEEALLDNAKSNYIAISEDNTCCYLLKSKRPRDTEGCIEIR